MIVVIATKKTSCDSSPDWTSSEAILKMPSILIKQQVEAVLAFSTHSKTERADIGYITVFVYGLFHLNIWLKIWSDLIRTWEEIISLVFSEVFLKLFELVVHKFFWYISVAVDHIATENQVTTAFKSWLNLQAHTNSILRQPVFLPWSYLEDRGQQTSLVEAPCRLTWYPCREKDSGME